MFKLNSKTALITGAASGIGEAIANALSAAGARVIVADFNRRDGERVAQACAANEHSLRSGGVYRVIPGATGIPDRKVNDS
jgi:NAD(P)-dependent dehydrogenase (short-subunit alcohol dehydrogenase family)